MKPFGIYILAVQSLSVWSLPTEYWYDRWRFQDQVTRALQAVEGILDTTRHPVLPGLSDNHTYDDKYALVETMTNTAIASYITVLEHLGLHSVDKIVNWVQNEYRPVVLRFEMNPTCVFDHRSERQVVTSDVEIERSKEHPGLLGHYTTAERENVKVKHTVVEYFWNVTAAYKLVLVSGEDTIELLQRNANNAFTTIKVTGGSLDKHEIPESPFANDDGRVRHQFPVTWLFQNIRIVETENGRNEAAKVSTFAIDRLARTCKTPARNDDTEKAWTFTEELVGWSSAVTDSFRYLNYRIAGGSYSEWPTTKNSGSSRMDIFSPVIPLFEASKVLPQEDFDTFLQSHNTSLTRYVDQTAGLFPKNGLMSEREVKIVTLLDHLLDRDGGGLVSDWQQSVGLVERLLLDQLMKAVGKEIDSSDFEEFMTFHGQRLLMPEYAPRYFSYAVRNGTTSFPDGLFSIEASLRSKSVPIETTVRHVTGGADQPSLSVPVTAATSVEIQGDRHIHGWLRYQWDGEVADLNLRARAHQFSSFVVLIGKMDGRDKFVPKDAIILQNKDDVLVPLLANVLPSAKEFKDAVSSLSPEQRAFAESFRAMQLQSSVFGVCVIQIKPQLERLLNLPAKSLAKEIQLTEDLMSLFVEYQIPSDLLSFDGDAETPTMEKVEAARGYVKAVTDVIAGAKKKQLEEESQRAMMKKHKGPTAEPTAGPIPAGPTAGPTAGPIVGRTTEGAIHLTSASDSSRGRRVLRATMESASEKNGPGSSDTEEGQHTTSAEDVPPTTRDFTTEETNDWNGGHTDISSLEDFTKIPTILDKRLESLDQDGALKSTILETGSTWSRSRQENLLEAPKKSNLHPSDIKTETNKAMDLLTALSRSGSLPIMSSELHIVVTVTHCFEKNIIDTVIKDNVNPIEKVEKSLLVLASTIQQVESSQLLLAKK